MDDEQSPTRSSGSLSIVRAAAVLILFVVAVTVLVAVGTRPSVSSTPTTTTTAAAGVASTTTTTAAGAASTTTTTSGHTTTTKAGHKGSGTTTTTVAPSSVSVVVANGTSVSGLAAHYSTVIGAGGWAMQTPVDTSTSEATSAVYYASGMQQPAASIATAIGVKPAQVLPLSASTPVNGVSGTDVVVVIGSDLASTTTTTVGSS
jgi:LytR cell envelope-related transcriptional attenuator